MVAVDVVDNDDSNSTYCSIKERTRNRTWMKGKEKHQTGLHAVNKKTTEAL